MFTTSLLVALILGGTLSECSHVLILSPFCSRSHKNSIDPAIDELVSRGHAVTELSMYVNGNSTGIRQYELKRLSEELGSRIPNPFNKSAENNLFTNLYHGIGEFAR